MFFEITNGLTVSSHAGSASCVKTSRNCATRFTCCIATGIWSRPDLSSDLNSVPIPRHFHHMLVIMKSFSSARNTIHFKGKKINWALILPSSTPHTLWHFYATGTGTRPSHFYMPNWFAATLLEPTNLWLRPGKEVRLQQKQAALNLLKHAYFKHSLLPQPKGRCDTIQIKF